MNESPITCDTLFYDGDCGLCDRAVRFVLARDRQGIAFRFAPLQGRTFSDRIPSHQRVTLPDSMVVLTSGGGLLMRSNAWIHILRRLGGRWQIIAAVLAVIPQGMRDPAYDHVAAIRYRVFGRRDDACPVAPPSVLSRFDS